MVVPENKLNKNTKEILFFDFDGTLVDHFATILKCYNYVLNTLGEESLSYEDLKPSMGASMPLVMEELVGKKRLKQAVDLFREYFRLIMHEDIKTLEGAEWILASLHKQGAKVVLFTNNPYADKIAEKLKFDRWLYEVIRSNESEHRKPEKQFTEFALNKVSVTPDKALLIGDTTYDIDAGACVGMPVHIVTTGSHSLDVIKAHTNRPTSVHSSLYELGNTLFDFKKDSNAIETTFPSS